MKTSHIEILAPAGTFASLNSAINAGCDAVYFGIADFNMRASAAINFTFENLPEVVKLCKSNNVKTYVTVNTLMYNDDLDMMRKVVNQVKIAGATAIIAADMATILYARKKNVRVHISTQVSISNTETVKFFSQFADVMVLARELTIEQIQVITDDIKNKHIIGPNGDLVKIEIFAHGALCVAVSGRCGMSLYNHNTSANRGKCAQTCRRPYEVKDKQTGQKMIIDNNYIMSAADLSTIGFLPEIIKTGISILKFEGRGRPPEYVDTVIKTYKQALQSIEDKTYNQKKVNKWNQKLGMVFNRGLSSGFYRGKKFYEWATGPGNMATEIKSELGIVEKYYKKINVAQIIIQNQEKIKIGDKIAIIGPTTGIVKLNITGMMIDNNQVDQAQQGDVITFKLKQQVRTNDKVYIFRKNKTSRI